MYTMEIQKFKDVLYRNFNTAHADLHQLFITACNGGEPVPFSKAYIVYEESWQTFPTSTFFGDCFIKIAKALKGITKLKGEKTLENLLQMCFSRTKHLECLQSLLDSGPKSESNIKNILAAHYFQPLTSGSECIIDKGSSNTCGHCKQLLTVGDTSLGNAFLWHGRADIIIKGSTVTVTTASSKREETDSEMDDDVYDDDDEAFFGSSIEVKLDKNNGIWAMLQALAEALVNAFCEARQNSSLSKKFIPSFLVTEKDVLIIWYNCHHDILLASQKMAIWGETLDKWSAKLNVDTLLQVWLAVNFDNFEMNVQEEILKYTSGSNFKNVVGEYAYSGYLQNVYKPMIHDCKEIQVHNVKKRPIQNSGLPKKVAENSEWYFESVKKIMDD